MAMWNRRRRISRKRSPDLFCSGTKIAGRRKRERLKLFSSASVTSKRSLR